MKKFVSLLLVLCFCLGLAACGKSASPSNASAAEPAAAAPAPATDSAPTPAPTAAPAPTPVPTPAPIDLEPLVRDLNAEEKIQRSEDDPSIGVFEVGTQKNTIIYKISMYYFWNVIALSQAGDAESIDAYNRVVESLPAVEVSLENALRAVEPELNIVVYLMSNEYSGDVVAVIDNGEITYDFINDIGTAPSGVTSILDPSKMPAEMRETLDAINEALANKDAG